MTCGQKRRVGQAPAKGNGPFVGSGRVTPHIPLIPPSANCQRTASGGANTIGSLHSFNGVVVPNFSLWIVCEPCALATASTGGLSAEDWDWEGQIRPLGTVPNGHPKSPKVLLKT